MQVVFLHGKKQSLPTTAKAKKVDAVSKRTKTRI
jgi:hypothetical protein